MVATQGEVIDALKGCYDPEIPVNIYDLGLIYEIDVQEERVGIKMTLTTAGCPMAQTIPEQVRARVQEVCHVDRVDVEVVWDPPWTPQMITEEGRKKLNL